MDLSTEFAGIRMHPFHIIVDWRMTTNYAAAVDDANPVYLGDQGPEGIIAPPMMAAALTWPISSKLGDYLETNEFPNEVLLTQVHYSERLDFHRPVRPGDSLTINGIVAGVLPHRAGTYAIMRYEAVDKDRKPVFTEHIGAMFRGVTCRGEGVSLNVPENPPGDYSQGPLWSHRIRIDPLLPYIYDGCTDIVFPIHTSPAFAEKVGLPGIILQGTCTLALAARELVNQEAGGEPDRLKALGCRFSGMVRPGTQISVDLKSRENDNFFFEVLSENGEKAVSKGYARIHN